MATREPVPVLKFLPQTIKFFVVAEVANNTAVSGFGTPSPVATYSCVFVDPTISVIK
jgi:hypothetical protein